MIQRSLQAMAKSKPEKLLELISTEEFEDLFVDAFKTRLKDHERDAVRLYAEAHKLVGAEQQTVVLIAQRYGLESEEELERVINRVKEADAMTDEQRFAKTCEFMRTYLNIHPEKKDEARRFVFGKEVESEVVE